MLWVCCAFGNVFGIFRAQSFSIWSVLTFVFHSLDVYFTSSYNKTVTALSIFYLILISPDPTAETVVQIKFVAYGVIAYIIVGVGIVGNVLSLVVLTRPNLKVI